MLGLPSTIVVRSVLSLALLPIPIVFVEQARADKPDYFLVLAWHFLDEFVKHEQAYLSAGGKFIVPLPEFRSIQLTAARASSTDTLL